MKDIISKFDIVKSQVYVNAKIVELDDNLVEEIGLKYGIFGGKAIPLNLGLLGLEIPNVSLTLAQVP